MLHVDAPEAYPGRLHAPQSGGTPKDPASQAATVRPLSTQRQVCSKNYTDETNSSSIITTPRRTRASERRAREIARGARVVLALSTVVVHVAWHAALRDLHIGPKHGPCIQEMIRSKQLVQKDLPYT